MSLTRKLSEYVLNVKVSVTTSILTKQKRNSKILILFEEDLTNSFVYSYYCFWKYFLQVLTYSFNAHALLSPSLSLCIFAWVSACISAVQGRFSGDSSSAYLPLDRMLGECHHRLQQNRRIKTVGLRHLSCLVFHTANLNLISVLKDNEIVLNVINRWGESNERRRRRRLENKDSSSGCR